MESRILGVTALAGFGNVVGFGAELQRKLFRSIDVVLLHKLLLLSWAWLSS